MKDHRSACRRIEYICRWICGDSRGRSPRFLGVAPATRSSSTISDSHYILDSLAGIATKLHSDNRLRTVAHGESECVFSIHREIHLRRVYRALRSTNLIRHRAKSQTQGVTLQKCYAIRRDKTLRSSCVSVFAWRYRCSVDDSIFFLSEINSHRYFDVSKNNIFACVCIVKQCLHVFCIFDSIIVIRHFPSLAVYLPISFVLSLSSSFNYSLIFFFCKKFF